MRSGGRWRRSQNRCSCSHRRTSRSPPKSASAFRRTGCSGPETHRDHEGHGPGRQGRRPLTYVIDVLNLLLFVLVIRVVLSYIPAPPGSALVPITRFFDAITEPVLRPVRRIVPTLRAGGAGGAMLERVSTV